MTNQDKLLYNANMEKAMLLVNNFNINSTKIPEAKSILNTLRRCEASMNAQTEKQYLNAVLNMQAVLGKYIKELEAFRAKQNEFAKSSERYAQVKAK